MANTFDYLSQRDSLKQYVKPSSAYKPFKLSINKIFNNLDDYTLGDLNALFATIQPKRDDYKQGNALPGTEQQYDDGLFTENSNQFNNIASGFAQFFKDQGGSETLLGDENETEKDKTGKVEGTGQVLEDYTPSVEYQSIPGIDPIEAKSVRDLVGADYTPRTAGRGTFGIESIAGQYGTGPNLGRVAFGRALSAGFTMEDIRNAMNSNSLPNNVDGDPLQVGGRVRDVLANPSSISSIYGGIPGETRGAERFQREDYTVNRAVGFSNLAIKDYLDAQPSRLNPKDMPGVAGGLYDYVANQLPKPVAGRAGTPAKKLLIGGSKIGQGAYASGIASSRSAAFQTGRANRGTSQYNRSNMGML